MKNASNLAREFLCKEIKLERITLNDVSGAVYQVENLKNCDIFRFSLFGSIKLGASKYIAVPRDSSEPFFLGELGE